MRVVVCITGASGAAYAVRLLQKLDCEADIVATEHGLEVLRHETGITQERLKRLGRRYYNNSVMNCDIASGGTRFDAVVVIPCSINTLSKIACGIGDNLVTRVAAVALKEQRRLVVVPREMPLSAIHLRNMAELSAAGAVVMPASPGFYNKPKTVAELVDFVAERVISVIGAKQAR